VARPRGLASAPVTWGVWERAEGDDLVPAELLLQTVAELGFAGIELGPPGYLDPRTIVDVGLELVGGFAPLHLDDEEAFEADLAAWLDPIAAALAATGRRGPVVLADAGRQTAVTLDGDRLVRALERVSRAAERCRDQGVEAVFHHHAGTYVETPEEIAALMQGTDVPLCLDTGHAVAGGGDPVELARTYAARIEHLHVKDVDPVLLERVRSGSLPFEQAWVDGIFCPLGDGMVDLRAVLTLPELQGFEGWIVLEQDRVAVRPDELPVVRAVEEANLRYVRDVLATP
jgi:inosose dehydratase